MLASISPALPETLSHQSEHDSPNDRSERRARITEGVYAACVFAAGVLLILTAV